MSEDKSSYKQIFKATSIFGGVQLVQIIIGIIRSKFIAVFLGPAGMGISGLLQSTTSIIIGLTNFGLTTSSVKNIAESYGSGHQEKFYRTVSVFRKLVWFTGSLGMAMTFCLSPWLSQLTFGNRDYTYAFMGLSVTLLLTQISAGQGVILRGMRRIDLMAKSGLYGSILGLLLTIPLYYFYGIDGIVPALIMASVLGLFFTWLFVKKIELVSTAISWSAAFKEGNEMMKMGFMISLGGLLAQGSAYLVRIFIGRTGSLEDVGFYNAGFAILNTYVGMIFTAMSADYYPRLSSTIKDQIQSNKNINQQTEVAILILSPILVLFIVFIKYIIVLLYSNKFIPIIGMLQFAVIGMIFKAISWSIAFIFLAKGEKKIFFWNELMANIITLLCNVVGYKFWGLQGLGYGFVLGFFIYLLQVYILANKLFGYRMNKESIQISILMFILISFAFILTLFNKIWILYSGGILLFLISSAISIYQLNKMMGLKEMLFKRIYGKKA